MASELDLSVDEFQESLIKISNSTIVALDELWAVSDSWGDQVSLLDTIHDAARPTRSGCRPLRPQRPVADAISACPSARSS